MTIKYIAYDETEFETQTECMEYEKKQEQIMSGIIFLDRNFDKLEDMQESVYLYIANQIALDYINEEYYGTEKCVLGWNIYDYEEDSYIPFAEYFHAIEKQYNKVMELSKKLNQITK